MTDTGPFFCRHCNKRLPINRLEGRAVVFCRHCKGENVLETPSHPTFRREIVSKA